MKLWSSSISSVCRFVSEGALWIGEQHDIPVVP